MSLGKDLLDLQETDLSLMRARAALDRMPEVADLARKRASLKKLKADASKLLGQRKDAEMALDDIDRDRSAVEGSVAAVQERGAGADYQEVKRMETELSSLAKRLDKLAFARVQAEERLSACREKEDYVNGYIAKFEQSILADAEGVRAKAGDLLARIDELKASRERLRSSLPAETLETYDAAAKEFNGLAVEQIEGNKPTVCRVALQASSMGDLHRGGSVARCPYCHRILVVDAEDEGSEQ